ncbi:MAG: HTTM domain-containing protein [Pirellulales bacterium]
MWSKFTRLFAIDPRALASFRIGLALLLLIDLAIRSHDLAAHYCDSGAVPRGVLADLVGADWRWSLHALAGSVWWEACLFALAALAAGALLAGWQTQVATCASWVLLVSLHNRNPLVLNGADTLLRMFLFWAMFLPLGHVWSFDAARHSSRHGRLRPVVSVASACLLIQLALTYFMAGYFKFNDVWQSGEGFRRALACDLFTRPPARLLLDYPRLTYLLSQLTLWGELLLPPLLFMPFATRFFRMVVMLFFLGMHAGIEWTMTVGMFSYTCLVGWFLFLPDTFWNRFGQLLEAFTHADRVASFRALYTRLRVVFVGLPTKRGAPSGPTEVAAQDGHASSPPKNAWWENRLLGGVAALMLGVVLLWNLATTQGPVTYGTLPVPIRRLAEMTYVMQKWNMFDVPPAYNTWSVVAGRCRDGRTIDLRHEEDEVDWGRPPDIAQLAPTHRWRKYFRNLTRRYNHSLRASTCRYLAARWNTTHAAAEKVDVVDLYLLEEIPVESHGPYRYGRRLLHHEVIESRGAFLDTTDGRRPADDALPPGI